MKNVFGPKRHKSNPAGENFNNQKRQYLNSLPNTITIKNQGKLNGRDMFGGLFQEAKTLDYVECN
jgi:hypothetical protein